MMPSIVPALQALQTVLATGSRWAETGDDPRTGCSCYGLIRWAYGMGGITLPEAVAQADSLFMQVAPPYAAWDVVLGNFTGLAYGVRHLALLTSPTSGYHCSRATNGVAQFTLTHAIWRRSILHVWRYSGGPLCT